jgi:hypothetical protein
MESPETPVPNGNESTTDSLNSSIFIFEGPEETIRSSDPDLPRYFPGHESQEGYPEIPDLQLPVSKLNWPFLGWLAIIAVGLLIVVVFVFGSTFAILEPNGETQTVNDIRQLSVAVESFKTKFCVYPPSRIQLSNDLKKMNQGSLAYLTAIWPRLNWTKIDWSGGIKDFTSATLEGDQCLVYFLNGPCGEGFSANPTNPTEPGGKRVGPFFEFPQERLIQRVKGNPFLSFRDGYDKNVYAFFSSARKPNDYRQDCPSLKVAPYFKKGSDPVRYYNASTFQIISAGKDGIFGPGGAWSPESAAKDVGPNGLDDLSNFHGDFLGK